MSLSFAVTWDYRCPFARNVHENILTGLENGADWDVSFLPFSLGQSHVQYGEPSVWEKPEQDSGILALQAGVVVRDRFPDKFLAVHRTLFSARHDQGLHIEEPAVIRGILEGLDIISDEVFDQIETGEALEHVRKEHEAYAQSHDVWGVPTFIVGEYAAFVRLMDRSTTGADPAVAKESIEHIVSMLKGRPELNEFKHTSVRR